MLALLTACWLGFLLGLRHAFEPDHLAALSTLIAERGRPGRAALLGAWWGLGHALALLCAGGGLLALGARMPARVHAGLELAVALMLIALGLRSLRAATRPSPEPGPARARRPLVVGLLHGLAGSGALAALALATLPSLAVGLLYLALFGLGAAAGMAALTALAGLSIERLAAWARARTVLHGAAGTLAVALGCVLALRLL